MATIPVQLKVEETVIQNLKRMARYQAVEKDKDISWQDLAREALYNYFPIPQGEDNSSKKKSNSVPKDKI